MSTMPFHFLLVLQILLLRNGVSTGSDTLVINQTLSLNQTLVSPSSIFELGFFKPGTSLKTYLGIWAKSSPDKKVVWVANRETPSYNPTSTSLQLSTDGNLIILLANSTVPIWSTSLTSDQFRANSTEAVLLDSGNLVIRDGSNPSTLYWQSFDYLTDTLLPGAKLMRDKRTGRQNQLVSWRNSEDPSQGMYSIRLDPNGNDQYIIEWNRSYRYWSSGNWNGEIFSSVPEMRLVKDMFNFSFISHDNESYFTCSMYNTSLLTRLVIDVSGTQQSWVGTKSSQWSLFWSVPKNQSAVYAFCGAFGFLGANQSCECLQGFTPYASNDWTSGGCVRKSPLACQDKAGNGTKDGFRVRSDLTYPSNPKAYQVATKAACELKCLELCSCTAYSYNNSGCFVWEGDLLNMLQTVPGNGNSGVDIYIRLAASELQSPNSQNMMKWMIPVVVISITSLIICLWICCRLKGKHRYKGKDKTGHDLILFDFYPARDSMKNEICNKKNGGPSEIELPSFSYESVAASTDNFADENKLGEGGYGPVYKGKLQKGYEVAVKRLSKRSGQGLEEFRNEAILIAKLQHRNLVRLLGCCIEKDENILIYEYMPNKSLDFFLFDPSKREILDLGSRIRIIEGVAQGLLYLHQFSRLRIVHRDLKPSNILLDSDMNPKISDFGMARIFGGSETQSNTNRIVGTYGYMAPEYATKGLISTKSDVFSFGVLILEILSGKKITSFYNTDSLNLLGYAWELWNSNQSMDLIDLFLRQHPSSSLLLRYINIGLLCVQENPNDRPPTAAVVTMITNEQAPLPTPKQPAFTFSWNVTDTTPSEIIAGNPSVNRVSFSTVDAR